ncbi:hypothetical protein ACVWYU_001613, partial [Pseudomonas sp. TE12234]
MPAKVVNDNACILIKRDVLEIIASKLAPCMLAKHSARAAKLVGVVKTMCFWGRPTAP